MFSEERDEQTETSVEEPAAEEAAGAPEAPVSGDPQEREETASPVDREAEERSDSGSDTDQAAGDGEPAAAQEVEQDIEELLEKASRQRDDYRALAQRVQADFENYRKRSAKERAAAETRGVMRLAEELLPALDNLALALAASGDAADAGSEGEGESARAEIGGESAYADSVAKSLAEGIRLVHAQLESALARMGIEAYSPDGEPFDPQLHEAMAKQPVDGVESGTVVEVYQRGYRLNGNVLRPARVVVAE